MNKSIKFILGGVALLCASQDVLGVYNLKTINGIKQAIKEAACVANSVKHTAAARTIMGDPKADYGNALAGAVDNLLNPFYDKLQQKQLERDKKMDELTDAQVLFSQLEEVKEYLGTGSAGLSSKGDPNIPNACPSAIADEAGNQGRKLRKFLKNLKK